ncbi:MAG: NADH-ubiquinone oxidoreductase-F iron-sulfur binding region domain-containing protein [Candidatus Dormiibacterota bacterium]
MALELRVLRPPDDESLDEPDSRPRLLAGPGIGRGAERFAEHERRLGLRPVGGEWLLDVMQRSGLRGRGGAWFPTHRKWRVVARAAEERGPATVVVNASEGEPLSAKDRLLVAHRPHLLLDGAMIAAETIGADTVVIYLSRPAGGARRALREALAERRRHGIRDLPVRMVATKHRYVAGESSSVVRRVNGGPSKPSFAPPHPSERGVSGRPTLVQNAETLVHAALIARHGDEWFRERGTNQSPGTGLVTVSGAVQQPGVYEVDLGSSLVDAVSAAGGVVSMPRAVLIGGYAGTWHDPRSSPHIVLSPDDSSLGCGIIGVLGSDGCALTEAAHIVEYLAGESAGQCGPCLYGLRDIAEAMSRLAIGRADRGDVVRIHRWGEQIDGRGACHHPDGAVRNVASALETFADDVDRHLGGHACPDRGRTAFTRPPRVRRGWR